ncbi:MMPL family transporter, partial [Candidatus Aminicenantes bacterium AC-335-B20]|nr:MMPL family transporter [Candidatus Aminicenantes bacterium AC-335-B20]
MLGKIAEFIIKKRWLVITVTGILTIFFIYQMKNLYFENRITEWLDKKDPIIKLFIDIGDKFGTNELVMIALKSRNGEIFSKENLIKLRNLTEKLKQFKEISHVKSIINMPDIKRIEDGIEVRDFLEDIPENSDELKKIKEYALSKESYVNNIISENGNLLALAIYIKSGEDPVKTFGEIIKPEVEKYFLKVAEIYYGGDPSTAYFADDFLKKDLKKLVPIIILAIVIILLMSFGNARGVILPSLVVFIATLWVFGLMGFMKSPMNLITPALPVLLIALGSAYGIHVMSKIFSANNSVSNLSPETKLKKAISEVFVPVIMAGLTTIIGFCSFLTAKFSIVSEFGIFSAIGILFSTLIAIFFIPAMYRILPLKNINKKNKNREKLSYFLKKISNLVINYPKGVIIISLTIFIIFILWIPKIEKKVNYIEYLPKNSIPRVSFNVIKRSLGGAYPLTIYFKGNNLKSPSILKIMRRIENYILNLPEAKNPFSITDFIQEINYQLNDWYHIPDTYRGVGNLWFFMEGREELKQVITEDFQEGLIFSKIPESDFKFAKNVRDKIKNFLEKEFSGKFYEYRLENLDKETEIKLRIREMENILDEIKWLSEYYGGKNSFKREIARKKLTDLIQNMPEPIDEDVLKIIDEKFKEYIFSDYFDFWISQRIKNELYETLKKEILRKEFKTQNILKILKKLIPDSEYDDEIANDVADTLIFTINEAKRIAFIERAIESLGNAFSENLLKNENFYKKMKGLLYEITDNLVILKEEEFNGIIGKQIKLEKVEQSGFPSFMTRLDKFLFTSQIQSLLLAFIVTFIVMVTMRKSFILGAISIIPITFTLGIIYGFLGLSNIPLDYVTMTIAGISIGVGIDYAIHLIYEIGINVDRGHPLIEAIRLSYFEKGKAIIVNSLAVMTGFAVLLLSSMSPLRHLGEVMIGSMFLSAFSALTILPAVILLVKP